jgi:hypothetical protein
MVKLGVIGPLAVRNTKKTVMSDKHLCTNCGNPTNANPYTSDKKEKWWENYEWHCPHCNSFGDYGEDFYVMPSGAGFCYSLK